mmetsp:Transcript_13351/g.35468  ORF Transcript_13351/g.35468 Transcript_13351/m.35468 type:complete len:724 (+) Transcript_13351:187-2358(+)
MGGDTRSLSVEEKKRRQEGALTVLRNAGADDFTTAGDFYARIGEAIGLSASMGKSIWSDVLKALPPGHELRQKFEAIKQRSQSSSGKSAAGRLGKTDADSKSLAVAKQERDAYAALRRRLASTQASGERLKRELKVATKAMAVSLKEVMGARAECACISGLDDAVEDFETAVGLAGSVGAVKVAPNGFCFVRNDLVEHGGTRWADFVDEQAAAIRKEDANERAYEAATGPAATVTLPSAKVMASAIVASGVDGRGPGALQALDPKDLESLYLQARAVQDKKKRPSRAAKTKGDDARHATAADAYGGLSAVLRPPVALARGPGHFARAQERGCLDDRAENIEKIADDLELKHKFLCEARVVVQPHRSSDEYGRLAPTPLDTGDKLQLAKILVRLNKGRFMIAALRANGEPILLVVGRGMIMDVFVGIRAPPIEAADAATRLRSHNGPGDAVSHKNYLKYGRGAAKMVAALRRVIVQMRLSGGDVAALVNRVMDQIDGRCEELAAGEAPTRGGTVPIYDSGDEGLGECPPGVDAADWATLKKGQESASFARLALASDFAAAASGLLGSLRGGAPGDKCGGDASDPVAVPTGGEAPPADDEAAQFPAGSKRTGKKDKFARGQEADADRFLTWKKFGPLDFDWATKANVTGAKAWAKPIKKTERLVDFWLRFSRGAAASIDQEYVVLHSSDAAPADVPGLVEAVDKCAAKARAGVEPAAKRARTVPV